jgi:uncharacterized protein (DUF58 family)
LTRAAKVWIAVSLIVIIVGWFKTINLLVMAGYFLLALLAVNLRLAWRATSRISAARLPTTPVFAGETFTISATVTSDADHPITTLVTAESGANRTAWMFAPLAAQEQKPIAARWTFADRGLKSLGPFIVDSSYPLGLVHVIRPIASADSVVVLPRVGAVDVELFRHWLRRRAAGDGETRRPSRRATPGNGDIRGLRAYRPGDSPREIHWKTSARINQLVVREYDRTEALDIVILIDPYLPESINTSDIVEPGLWQTKKAENAEAIRRLEWTFSLAVSLAMALCHADSPAELMLILPGNPPQSYRGRASLEFVRQAFAHVAVLPATARVPLVPADFVRPRSGRASRLVLSPRADSPLLGSFRQAGLTCADISAERPPLWFVPPPGLQKMATEPNPKKG